MNQSDIGVATISLVTAEDGSDRVVLHLANGMDASLSLTASQARMLATRLITTVNRVDVKANLKGGSNLWRSQGKAPSPSVDVSRTSLKPA